jgi:two-component system, OmpR family, response regulator VanR
MNMNNDINKSKALSLLLIDDEELIRDSLNIAFESEFRNFLAVESAEKGLDVLGSMKFDVIICDYQLQGMNGLDFLKHVSFLYPDVMRLLITAYGDDEELIKLAWSIGVNDIIVKPFSPDIIVKSIVNWLAQSNTSYES